MGAGDECSGRVLSDVLLVNWMGVRVYVCMCVCTHGSR